MKRTKPSRRRTPKRAPKLPDELLPIVDAVVEIVFERLRTAATPAKSTKIPPASRKTAKLNLPLPKQRTALAEALADLLLADLASRSRAPQKANGPPKAKGLRGRAERPAPRSRRRPSQRGSPRSMG